MFGLAFAQTVLCPNDQYDRTYSCWPVIITPYNLPPGICLSYEYMFLTMVIPGPPLIKELLQLWHVGVRTYDHAMKNKFIMRVALMWTVNGLPGYGWRLDGVPPG
ncbi:UNVERIFIED_CONTAM: hypothetical protein Slati_0248900 [Sesamum latifolium]|uniref:Uncharacterized protein n=1 Tax=Sesamum latifolium TaxID=2727402 RepID=A0AAW2YD45_9LAMI